ncbi:MAG TPA: hypothetical protein VFZ00_25915 [Solirubrobacter sp.]|nr:hypothetical protein [Solirubrobacter sp.]
MSGDASVDSAPRAAPPEHLPALALLARARLALGDVDGAEPAVRAAAGIATACGTPFVRVRARLLAAAFGAWPCRRPSAS